MHVLCLCLGGCHPHSRTLAQGLHWRWGPLQMQSKSSILGYIFSSLDGDLILEPYFWECLCFYLCLDMSYSNFINLAQGLHNWWDPLQMRCHFSKHTIWATLLVSGPRSNPWAKLLEMPVVCLCLGKPHSHSRTLAEGFLNQEVDPKCGSIPQNDEYEARSLAGDLILEPKFGKCMCFAYA